MPLNNGSPANVNGYREPHEISAHEYFSTQDTLLRAAAERESQLDNLLILYRKKVQRLIELKNKATKSAADTKLIEALTTVVLNMGTMLQSKNRLNTKEQKFLADLLAANGPVKAVYLARGVSRRR